MESSSTFIKFPMTKRYRTSNLSFLFSIFIITISTSCNEVAKQGRDSTEALNYTCSMHPQIVQEKPGVCPICGMNLIRLIRSDSLSNSLMLTDTQIKLANITTQPISKNSIGQSVAINGRLTVDELHSQVISSRAAGRVEKLFFKETGQSIQKGQPLYVLYSESLLTLQQEYLLAKEQYEAIGKNEKRYQSFLEASEKKLLLYGLTKNQINQLTNRSSLHNSVTFLSPASGIITEINVAEGESIAEGALLYKIEDISKLWVEAELYPNETSLVKVGDKITVGINGNNSVIEADVIFLSPEYRSNTQINILRAALDNSESKYKPGQQVYVNLTHSSKEALALPIDAVIRDGNGAHVYIQAGRNTFRPRMVKTGLESFNQVEITEGINDGDTVAISGAYLLYSEMILKKGIDPMVGHEHREN